MSALTSGTSRTARGCERIGSARAEAKKKEAEQEEEREEVEAEQEGTQQRCDNGGGDVAGPSTE